MDIGGYMLANVHFHESLFSFRGLWYSPTP